MEKEETKPVAIDIETLTKVLRVIDNTKPVNNLTRELLGRTCDVLENIVEKSLKFTGGKNAQFILQKPVEVVETPTPTPTPKDKKEK